MAALSKNYHKQGAWERECVPFDTVVTNQNSNGLVAYNNETGHFMAPVDGTYVFHVHVLQGFII